MIRLVDSEGVSVDLLVASSGIEAEIVAEAEVLEVAQGIKNPGGEGRSPHRDEAPFRQRGSRDRFS